MVPAGAAVDLRKKLAAGGFRQKLVFVPDDPAPEVGFPDRGLPDQAAAVEVGPALPENRLDVAQHAA